MRPWENPEFLRLRREGMSTSELTAYFKKPYNSVRSWIRDAVNAGLVPRTAKARDWTTEEKDELKRLRLQGVGMDGCAKALNRTRSATEQQCVRMGLKLGIPTQWNAERDAELTRLFADVRLTRTAIAKRMGTTLGAVIGRANRLKLSRQEEPKAKREPAKPKATKPKKIVPQTGVPVEEPSIIPAHARPFLTRLRGECAYPYGERFNIHSCCRPTFNNGAYCEAHSALCFIYPDKARVA